MGDAPQSVSTVSFVRRSSTKMSSVSRTSPHSLPTAGDVRVSNGRVERRMIRSSSSSIRDSAFSYGGSEANRRPLDVFLAPRLSAPHTRARTPTSMSPGGWSERQAHLSSYPVLSDAQPSRYGAIQDLTRVSYDPHSRSTAVAFPGPRGWDRPATSGSPFGVASFASSTGLMTPYLTHKEVRPGVPRGISVYDGAAGTPSPLLRNNRAQPVFAATMGNSFVRAPSALAGSTGALYHDVNPY